VPRWTPTQRPGVTKEHSHKERESLTKRFLKDVEMVWQQRGIEALQKVAIKSPDKFLMLVAELIPKDVNIEHISSDARGLSETAERIRDLLSNAAGRHDPALLPDGSILSSVVRVPPDGCGEAVDSGAVQGSPSEP
jgi:hypothetical protein